MKLGFSTDFSLFMNIYTSKKKHCVPLFVIGKDGKKVKMSHPFIDLLISY